MMIPDIIVYSLMAGAAGGVANAIAARVAGGAGTAATTFLASGAIAYVTTTTAVAFIIVSTAPVWLVLPAIVIAGLSAGMVRESLAQRGFLGNKSQWIHQLSHRGDREFEAALHVLNSEEVDEIANVSSDKKDFRENVVASVNMEKLSISETLNRDTEE